MSLLMSSEDKIENNECDRGVGNQLKEMRPRQA